MTGGRVGEDEEVTVLGERELQARERY